MADRMDHLDDRNSKRDKARREVDDLSDSEVDGATVGGASGLAAGAAIGAVTGGPMGAIIGAAAGALTGVGIAKGIDAVVNPDEEDKYWRENHSNRPYATADRGYEDYQPAYRYGWESRARDPNRKFDDSEGDLERGWDEFKGKSRLKWNEAKHATRDAWHRVDERSARR